ncbi:hypothetical protein ACKWTF_006784 [Chironomus riparius]
MDIKTFLKILLIPFVFGMNISYPELSREIKNLVEAFKIIRNDLRQTFNTKGCTLLTIPDPDYKESHEGIKSELIKSVIKYETLRLRDIKLLAPKTIKFSIILVDNMKVFRESKKFINSEVLQYSGYHIVIMLDANMTDVQEIFTKFWSKNIYNVVVLMNIYEETLLLNFEPFNNSENCRKVSVKVVNSFQNGKFINKFGSWKKFQNLNQCPITVTTCTDSIAVFRKTLSDGSYVIHGYEYEMIQFIAKMLNFSLNIIFKEGHQQWGIVFENGTCTRGFEDLKNRKTDILFSDLFLKELRVKYFDPSVPYLNRQLFFALSQQPRLNMFQKMLSPFESIVWILIVLTLCIGISTILVINLKYKLMKSIVYGESVDHPFTNLFASFIGQALTKLPRKNFARMALMTFLIFSLVIRSAYQGSLYKFLQSDGRHKEPQTIAELIDKKYTFVLAKSNIDIVKDSHPKMYSASYILKENDEPDLDLLLNRFQRAASFASKKVLMNYSMTHDSFPYKLCKEQFLTLNIVMFYNKNFFLKSAIDEVIQQMSMHGFMDHWIKDYDKTDKWKFIDRKPSVMTFDHLTGSFCLLLIGYVLSALAFVLEMLNLKWKRFVT